MEIAPFKKSRKQNAPGNLYVDESCIDCDVCRWMSPNVSDYCFFLNSVILKYFNNTGIFAQGNKINCT